MWISVISFLKTFQVTTTLLTTARHFDEEHSDKSQFISAMIAVLPDFLIWINLLTFTRSLVTC